MPAASHAASSCRGCDWPSASAAAATAQCAARQRRSRPGPRLPPVAEVVERRRQGVVELPGPARDHGLGLAVAGRRVEPRGDEPARPGGPKGDGDQVQHGRQAVERPGHAGRLGGLAVAGQEGGEFVREAVEQGRFAERQPGELGVGQRAVRLRLAAGRGEQGGRHGRVSGG